MDLITPYGNPWCHKSAAAPPKPERLEVPAILNMKRVGGIMCIDGDFRCVETLYTCAEKSRILEHSEDGKYWCRKVQP